MHVLAELAPLDPVTGSRVTLRATTAQDRRVTTLNSVRWWPALTEVGPRRIQTFDGNFQAGIALTAVPLTLLIDKLEKLSGNARRYVWAGADVTLYMGSAGAAWPWTTLLTGKVSAFQADGNKLTLTASVDAEPFQRNVLPTLYAGTGGAEGPSDLKNVPKPFLAGRCRNVEPILIDAVNSVFQFHGYGPISVISALYERGSAFSASIGNFTTYATLVAATIPPGKWATCTALGMVRLGAPPFGVITADVDGDKPSTTWFSKTGEIINRIATNAGVASGDLNAASLTALDTAISTLTGGGGIIGVYLTAQETVLDLATRLARGCNAQAGVSHLGQLYAARPAIGSPVAVFDAQSRRLPGVYDSSELDVSPPYARMEMTGFRSWRVHTPDEIASNVVPTDMGTYDATQTYREGAIVFQPADGNRYYYSNPTPTAGNDPPNDSFWDLYQVADPSIADLPATILGPNANRVPFSRFEKINPPWYAYDPSGIVSAGNPFTGVYLGRNFFKAFFTATAVGQAISLYHHEVTRPFTVTPGERLSCQVGVEATSNVGSIVASLDTYDASGAPIQRLYFGNTSGPQAYNTKLQGFVTIPSGAVKSRLIVDFYTNASGAGFVNIIEPMVTQAGPEQAVHPAFTPGPNAMDAADVTASNTAAAISGQGALATANFANWLTQVTGAGKPVSYATRNDDGANMIPSPILLDQCQFSGTAFFQQTATSTGRPADFRRVLLQSSGCTARWCGSTAIPCIPGERLYYSDVIISDGGSSETCNVSVSFYKPDGSGLTAINLSSQTSVTLASVSGVWTRRTASFVVPGGAAFVQPYVERPVFTSFTFFVGEPFLGRSQQGADITGINVASAILGQGAFATINQLTSGGQMAGGVVGTGHVAGGAITANQIVTGGDVYCPVGSTTAVLGPTGWMTIGDGVYGSGIVSANFTHDSTVGYDGSALYQLLVDTGGGFVVARQSIVGITTSSGDTFYRVSVHLQTIVSGSAVRVQVNATPGAYLPASVARPFYCRDIAAALGAAKR